jgi:hypothetical protein
MSERADMYKGAHKIATLHQYTDNQTEVTLRMRYTDGSLRYEFYRIND